MARGKWGGRFGYAKAPPWPEAAEAGQRSTAQSPRHKPIEQQFAKMRSSSLIRVSRLGHFPVSNHDLQGLTDVSGSIPALGPSVVHTPGGGIDLASPWIPFGDLLQAAATADISMGNAYPQVNHTPLKPHGEGAHEHVSRINWRLFFRLG